MTSALPVLPVVIPLASAALGLAAWRSLRAQRGIGVLGATGLLAATIVILVRTLEEGVLVSRIGGWAAPFGITLATDVLSAVMVLLTGITGFAVAVYYLVEVDERRQSFAYFPFLHLVLAGVGGSFVTADLFNLYVWFEVMLIGSFALLALGGGRASMEGAMKYVALNMIGSAIFLTGLGVLYGVVRTLNMGDASNRLATLATTHPHLVTTMASLFLVAFALKAGLFPLYFWLPPSYPTPPAAVSALFAGLLTKVGVYALLRTFAVVFPAMERTFTILLLMAGLTMVIGVLGAVGQFEIRRILSFHILSQIGYMVAAIGLLGSGDPAVRRLALVAVVFYIGHHIVVKANLFLIGGIVKRLRGTVDLARLGGLANAAPWLAILFLVPALSLAGIPPLSGFWAKLSVIRAALEAGAFAVVAAALFAGLLTLVSMIKIWNEAFWKPAPEGEETSRPNATGIVVMAAPCVALAAITVAIGVWPQALLDIADRAADQLLDPAAWARAIGGAP